MDAVKRLIATVCLTLHVLLAAAGAQIDARLHVVAAAVDVAVAPAPEGAGGTLLHPELCGLCRALQHLDAPPTTPLVGPAIGAHAASLPPEPNVSLASTLRTSSLGARAPPA